MTKKAKTAKPEKVTPYRSGVRYGILSHVGGIWTPETFENEGQARAYLKGYNAAYPFLKLGKHKVVPVRVTVSVVTPKT